MKPNKNKTKESKLKTEYKKLGNYPHIPGNILMEARNPGNTLMEARNPEY